MVASLWFCPTLERIGVVVKMLDGGVDGADAGLLISTVHGLHAAMLNWFRYQRTIVALPNSRYLVLGSQGYVEGSGRQNIGISPRPVRGIVRIIWFPQKGGIPAKPDDRIPSAVGRERAPLSNSVECSLYIHRHRMEG